MEDDDGNDYGFKTNKLVDNIPTDVLDQFIHRLLSSLDEYTLEGKDKAYGIDTN